MSSQPTFIEDEQFLGEYRSLATALAIFWDIDEGQTDATFTQAYVSSKPAGVLEELLLDGQRFLNQHKLPLCLIDSWANRYLVTEAEQRQWLQTLLDRVQAELEVRRGGAGRASTPMKR